VAFYPETSKGTHELSFPSAVGAAEVSPARKGWEKWPKKVSAVGAAELLTLRPTQRSKFFVGRGMPNVLCVSYRNVLLLKFACLTYLRSTLTEERIFRPEALEVGSQSEGTDRRKG
jgi:hypothetical protein